MQHPVTYVCSTFLGFFEKHKLVCVTVYELKDRHEVYTWGDNSNFTLGHTSEHRRSAPEVVDEFRKLSVNLKQVNSDVDNYFSQCVLYASK